MDLLQSSALPTELQRDGWSNPGKGVSPLRYQTVILIFLPIKCPIFLEGNNALVGATPMLVEPANITSKRRPGLTPLEDAALILQDIAASPTGAGGQPLKEPG